MALQDYYFYGQGKVFSKRLDTVGGKWRWWGDVSSLEINVALQSVQHTESYSGNKGIARQFAISKALTVKATLHQLDTDSLAEQVYGASSIIAAGAVVAEPLPTVLAGDTVKLEFGGASALSIVDSAATPVVLAASNYVFDARFGSLDINTVPAGAVQPFKASYTRAAGKQVNMLTQAQPILLFRYEGINLAEGNAPVIVEIYRMATEPLQQLALINNDTKLSQSAVNLAGLIDTSKSATGSLGQFGRIIQLPAA